MEQIEYKGQKYRVKYTHIRPILNGKIQSRGGTTVAFITDREQNVIASGQANVSLKDTYQKKLGRIIATGRLLKALGLPRK